MDKALAGFAIGLIIAIVAAIFGKRVGEGQAVVTKQDVMEGVVTRKVKHERLKMDTQAALHDAQVESEKVSEQIRRAPNEEIVRMFIDAFDKPASNRGRR